MASAGEVLPSSTAATCSPMGISTPWAAASSSNGRAVFTPSATMRMSAMMSSRERPRPSCSPTIRFRLRVLVQVATRSPTPARPAMVMRSPAHGHAQATKLGQAPGDERRQRRVAETQALEDAGRDGEDVLGGAGHLAPHDVGVGVHPERRGAQQLLDLIAAIGLVGHGHDGGRRLAGGDLPGQVRPGEHADGVAGDDLGDDLGHAQLGSLLEALGQRQHGGAGRQRTGDSSVSTARNPCEGTAMTTRARAGDGLLERRRGPQRRRAGRRRGGSRGSRGGGRWPRPAPVVAPRAPSAPSDAAMAATVVPHEPAPMTATLSSMRPTLRPGPCGGDGGGPYTDRVTAAPVRLPPLTGSVVLVPVKAFGAAKARLAPTLDAAGRAQLARVMAARVLAAADPLPVAVVCDDPEVAQWAAAHGALVLPEPGRGLNGAVEAGVERLRRGRGVRGRSWPTPTCPSPTRWPSWRGSRA